MTRLSPQTINQVLAFSDLSRVSATQPSEVVSHSSLKVMRSAHGKLSDAPCLWRSDDFMAGEEEEGEEGIGANPDEDYDYSALADAMDGSDNDSASDSDSDESAPSDDDAELDPAGDHVI